MQVGSEDKKNTGIHAHMYMDNDIYYAPDDEKRQKISWVKSVDKQGKETVYTAPDSLYREKDPPAELVRKMDCVDCHNRPTHRFPAPYKLINEAMAASVWTLTCRPSRKRPWSFYRRNMPPRARALEAIRRKLTAFLSRGIRRTVFAEPGESRAGGRR